jgi:hypothetical protein
VNIMAIRRMLLHIGADEEEICGERQVWEKHGKRELDVRHYSW